MTFDTSFLAGYQTSTDVSELARIDLDILQIDLFMRTNAYDLARSVFQNGRNSHESNGSLLSLHELAVRDERRDAGELFRQFEDFYMTTTYANEVINLAIAQPDG